MRKCGIIYAQLIVIKRVTNGDGSKQYDWEVEFVDDDARGTRKLGYRGSGIAKEVGYASQFKREPEVHDENIDRWTQMNLTDRPDVRKRMIRLATNAILSLAKNGEDTLKLTVNHSAI